MEIKANTLKKMFWNEVITSTTDAVMSTRTGAYLDAAGTAPSATDGGSTMAWHATTLSNPNGSDIGSTAAKYLQYKIDLTADDTTSSNPKIYLANGYCLKYDYRQQGSDLDDSVEFRYKLGLRNFNLPMIDKILKKVLTRHDGSQGSFLVKWETEHSTGEFTVDLSNSGERWDSFFPSDATGQEVTLEIYKNDLNAFTLKELALLYTPEPLIM